MVSKIKKPPTKPIKSRRSSRRHQHRRRSPANNGGLAATSAVIASINKSFYTCKRRLSKFISKLVRISTPNRLRRYKVIKKRHSEEQFEEFLLKRTPPKEERLQDLSLRSIRRALAFNYRLPPLIFPRKRTIFLDLDETLIHSKTDPPPERFNFIVRPVIEGVRMNFYVLKRPGVDEFLERLASKFELVVFTAGLKEYASLVLDQLDKKSLISHRLYRDSCTMEDGRYVKDLSQMGRDLSRVVIVDDNPNSYTYQPENAIPIRAFTDDPFDEELLKLVKFFEASDSFDDMRKAVKCYIAEEEYNCTSELSFEMF